MDAQASSTRTGIGGWFPRLHSEGCIDQWNSHKFAIERWPEAFSWVLERGNKPSLVASALEALAVLMALKLYNGDRPSDSTTKVTLFVPTYADNRSNGSALNKLMSTKFPSTAFLMEMSFFF